MTASRPDRSASSPALLLLVSLLLLCSQLTCVTAATDDASSSSSSSSGGSSTACTRWSCGPLPMVLVLCADGSHAGYSCQDVNGRCTMMPPHCASGPLSQLGPISHNASDDSNDNNTAAASSSSSSTLAAFPNADPAAASSSSSASLSPPAASSTSSSSSASSLHFPAVAAPPYPQSQSQSPPRVFNCSRQQCGPLLALYILSCPSGRSAHPLCAWLPSAGRCGYLPASCDFPDYRDAPLPADCEGGGAGCVLPQYVRDCGQGQTVAPYCRWDDDSSRCAAVEPLCPTDSPAAAAAGRGSDSGSSSAGETVDVMVAANAMRRNSATSSRRLRGSLSISLLLISLLPSLLYRA